MVTSASLAMKATVEELRPLLTSAGFRKRSHTFNRTVAPGLVHVVNFQMGPFDPPGTVEIPGLRPNLYGQFAVNLGVFIEEAWRLGIGAFDTDGPPRTKNWVNEYDCQLRRRVDNLAEDSSTGWWPLDDPGVGPAISDLFQRDAFVWFDRFDSRDAIRSALENAPTGSRAISGVTPDRLLATRMRLGAGDQGRAQELFDEWVSHCRSLARTEPHVRGHLEYLTGFAAEVGLAMPPADQDG